MHEDEDIERVERQAQGSDGRWFSQFEVLWPMSKNPGVDKQKFSSIINAAAVRILEDMLRHEDNPDDYRYWKPEWGKPNFGKLCTDNPFERQADDGLKAMQECLLAISRNNVEAERLNCAAEQLLKEMNQFLETEYGCQE